MVSDHDLRLWSEFRSPKGLGVDPVLVTFSQLLAYTSDLASFQLLLFI